jgi:hypothetical protein
MLQYLDESEEVLRFIQALYNLEGWEIAGVEYTVYPERLVKIPTEDTDLVEDWFIKRTSSENILKYSSLFNCDSRYRQEEKTS